MRMPIIAGAVLLAWSASAPAAWQKASSPHFVIFAAEKVAEDDEAGAANAAGAQAH